jgi:hypothetical protein
MESSRKAQERLAVLGERADYREMAGLLVKQTERELEQC